MSIATTNPVNGKVIKTYEAYSASEVEQRIQQAHQAYTRALPNLAEEQKRRQQVLLKAAGLLEERKQELGRIMTLEMGKTLKSAIQEVEKCALNCRHYAETGLKSIAPETIDLGDAKKKGELRYLPIGIVLAIMPWNFPLWQVFRCAAPILLAGNSYVLKHASNVPQSALAIEKIWLDAGLTEGAFQTLLVGSDAIAGLIDDPRIQGITLTGSEGAGRDVASRAGKAIKKSVMELGGSDPFIVMPSANVTLAAETAVTARMICNGQSCIAAKRFIVHDSIYEGFKTTFVETMKKKVMGDPMLETTDLGPVVSMKAREDLHDLVTDAVKNGARVLLGGEIPKGEGAYYPATVIENVSTQAKLRQEEAFGPVAVLYRVKTLEEAIQIANSTRFGLGASFWSTDPKEIDQATTQIQSGSVFVNELVASDPRLAFGGVKSSGYGRELGVIGMREFTNLKTVVLKS
jgi:succinate-semialdehyde dehydrogenase/glutarate-semialdehyde dehydrogenase